MFVTQAINSMYARPCMVLVYSLTSLMELMMYARGYCSAGECVLLPLLALPRQRLRYRSKTKHVHDLWLRPCIFWFCRLH